MKRERARKGINGISRCLVSKITGIAKIEERKIANVPVQIPNIAPIVPATIISPSPIASFPTKKET